MIHLTDDLTPGQHQVMSYLIEYRTKNGRSPTSGEIRMHLGESITRQAIHQRLLSLCAKGYIRIEPGKHRGVTVLKTVV